jgi:hypothetical protein
MLSWLRRRVQPLQLHTHFGYEYTGVDDPSRIASEELDDRLALRMLRRAFLGVLALPVILELFSVERPPTLVSS